MRGRYTFYMKKAKRTQILLFFTALLTAVLVFTGILAIEHRAPKLYAEAGELSVESGMLEDELYMLEGEWGWEDGAHTLLLRFDTKDALCLYLPESRNATLTINGLPAEYYAIGDYDIYSLAGGNSYMLRLTVTKVNSLTSTNRYLYLGPINEALSVMQRRVYQRMVIVGITLASLIYSLSLYAHKPSEYYLLLFALYALSTFLRTARNAFPTLAIWTTVFVWLDSSTMAIPGLSLEANAAIYVFLHSCFLFLLRYSIVRNFTPAHLGRYIYSTYVAAFFGICILSAAFAANIRFVYWLGFGVILLCYVLELFIYTASTKDSVVRLMIPFWAASVPLWALSFAYRNDLFSAGMLMTQYGVTGIQETLYLLGFLIAINGKFARKFAEADKLTHSLEEQVAQQTEALRSSYTTLQRTQQQKAELTSNMMHSLKTPLFSIIGYSEMLGTEIRKAPEAAEAHAEIIHDTASYIQQVINSLRLSTRLEEGGVVFRCSEFDLCELLAEIRTTSMPRLQKAGLRITLHCPESPCKYTGDRFYLGQAIQNLVDNAVENSPTGTEVSVTLERLTETDYSILVRDMGYGIEAEDLPHIFERYYSRHRGRGGSGLGLSIAQDIVAQHEGRITVESEKGAGSSFQILLPGFHDETDLI